MDLPTLLSTRLTLLKEAESLRARLTSLDQELTLLDYQLTKLLTTSRPKQAKQASMLPPLTEWEEGVSYQLPYYLAKLLGMLEQREVQVLILEDGFGFITPQTTNPLDSILVSHTTEDWLTLLAKAESCEAAAHASSKQRSSAVRASSSPKLSEEVLAALDSMLGEEDFS